VMVNETIAETIAAIIVIVINSLRLVHT